MIERFHKWLGGLRFLAVASFAVAQMVPSGFALASDGAGFSVVICTEGGASSVSWEDLTGGPSPFAPPKDHQGGGACHVCAVGGCAGGHARVAEVFLPNVVLQTPAPESEILSELVIAGHAGRPPPSRGPPVFPG